MLSVAVCIPCVRVFSCSTLLHVVLFVILSPCLAMVLKSCRKVAWKRRIAGRFHLFKGWRWHLHRSKNKWTCQAIKKGTCMDLAVVHHIMVPNNQIALFDSIFCGCFLWNWCVIHVTCLTHKDSKSRSNHALHTSSWAFTGGIA